FISGTLKTRDQRSGICRSKEHINSDSHAFRNLSFALALIEVANRFQYCFVTRQVRRVDTRGGGASTAQEIRPCRSFILVRAPYKEFCSSLVRLAHSRCSRRRPLWPNPGA